MTLLNETEYKNAFAQFDSLVSQMADKPELQTQAREVAEAIQAYEHTFVPFQKPTTLTGMIELRMYEMKLKQKGLANLLGVEASRVSELLKGKRKVSLEIAKRLHGKLGIDGNFILETA